MITIQHLGEVGHQIASFVRPRMPDNITDPAAKKFIADVAKDETQTNNNFEQQWYDLALAIADGEQTDEEKELAKTLFVELQRTAADLASLVGKIIERRRLAEIVKRAKRVDFEFAELQRLEAEAVRKREAKPQKDAAADAELQRTREELHLRAQELLSLPAQCARAESLLQRGEGANPAVLAAVEATRAKQKEAWDEHVVADDVRSANIVAVETGRRNAGYLLNPSNGGPANFEDAARANRALAECDKLEAQQPALDKQAAAARRRADDAIRELEKAMQLMLEP